MLVLHDERALLHDTGPGHPERIERLEGVRRALRRLALTPTFQAQLGWDDAGRLLGAIQLVHPPSYVERLRRACESGARYIDAVDSVIGRGSYEAALASAACALIGAAAIADGAARCAFSAMRPPGHHCERDRSMGFCLLNNVAIAAEWLVRERGFERLVIVDFDVHHGNGTQHLFEDRGDIFYVSTHQHPATLYPGTGYEWETGTRGTPGEGRTLNVPLRPGSGHAEALGAFDESILPRLAEYRPQMMLISAGFDADWRDPLASLNWTPDTFSEITRRLCAVAANSGEGRILSVLEGGYDIDALAEGLERHLAVLRAESGR